MKKFLSALMAFTVVATMFATSAFAAVNVGVKSNAPAEGVEAGNEFVVTMELTGDEGFANFALGVKFDTNTFEFIKAAKTKRTDWDGVLVGGDPTDGNKTGIAKLTFANASDNAFADDEVYKADFTFKVKDGAVGGTYNFEATAIGAMKNQSGVEIKPTCSGTDVVVKASAPAEVAAEFDTAAASKFTYGDVYNYGVGGAVTVPEGKSATGVTFDISNGTKTVNYDFDFGTSIAADTSFGLNICGVPVGVELSFSNLQVK